MAAAHRFLLLLATLVALQRAADAHGYLALPQSRNYIANSDYCPHCLNAGGPATVAAGRKWPNGRGGHGLCGDPASEQPRPHEAGGKYATGKIAATYTQGQVVRFDVVVSAFHKGRFGFRICKINGRDAASEKAQFTEACLDQNQLVQANVAGTQNPGDLWFHLGQENRGKPCGGCLVEGTVHTSYYQLPRGLTCDGVNSKCVLQWYWLSGNSCNPPGESPPWGDMNMDTCGDSVWNYPEEFWNCADILIKPSGDPVDPQPAPSPAPNPSPKPTASPSPKPIASPSPKPIASPSPKPIASPSPSPEQPQESPVLPPDSPPPVVPDPPVVVDVPPCEAGDAECFCKWVKRDGFFPDLSKYSRCRNYYLCSQDGARMDYMTCPLHPLNYKVTLRFNIITHTCDYARNVKCPRYNVPVASPPPPSPQPQPPAVPCPKGDAGCFCQRVAPTDDGVFPDTANGCSGFYQCSPAGSQYVECAPGTSFSASLGYCDWSQNVLCPIITSFVELKVSVAVASRGVTQGLPSAGAVFPIEAGARVVGQ